MLQTEHGAAEEWYKAIPFFQQIRCAAVQRKKKGGQEEEKKQK